MLKKRHYSLSLNWYCCESSVPSGRVQRKCSGYFTQFMYVDRTGAPRKGLLWDGAAGTPPSSSFFFFFSLSQEVGYMSLAGSGSWCTIFSGKWPYLVLFMCLHLIGVKKNPNTLNISFWIHMLSDISNLAAGKKRKQYWYINHMILGLLTAW